MKNYIGYLYLVLRYILFVTFYFHRPSFLISALLTVTLLALRCPLYEKKKKKFFPFRFLVIDADYASYTMYISMLCIALSEFLIQTNTTLDVKKQIRSVA